MNEILSVAAPFVALFTHYGIKFAKSKVTQQIAKALMKRMMADFNKGAGNVGTVPGSSGGGAGGSGSSGGSSDPGIPG